MLFNNGDLVAVVMDDGLEALVSVKKLLEPDAVYGLHRFEGEIKNVTTGVLRRKVFLSGSVVKVFEKSAFENSVSF